MSRIFNLIFLMIFNISLVYGQSITKDSLKLDYRKIYGLCLDANIPEAYKLLNVDTQKISTADRLFIADFRRTFENENDNSNYLQNHTSPIDDLLKLFQNYWRQALLNPSKNYDNDFWKQLQVFLIDQMFIKNEKEINKDSLNFYFNSYIQSKKLFSTDGIGKTGKLFDLLVWSKQKDTTYTFKIGKETISANVIFMQDFVTLGWEEYATLGKYYPGGWATKKALYCVEKAYDLKSENFLISYLAHESRHFKDYQLFPKLKSADLEYRAKLTELSLANATIFNLIKFFISNSNYNSENGHQVANYCAIRDLSLKLFNKEFEADIEKWKAISIKKINKVAFDILKRNSKDMKKNARTIESYIKK